MKGIKKGDCVRLKKDHEVNYYIRIDINDPCCIQFDKVYKVSRVDYGFISIEGLNPEN